MSGAGKVFSVRLTEEERDLIRRGALIRARSVPYGYGRAELGPFMVRAAVAEARRLVDGEARTTALEGGNTTSSTRRGRR
jgi:uncharacterized protein (DUF1778 family)